MEDAASTTRVAVFFDGQNLFHAAREVFSEKEANYDPKALSEWVAEKIKAKVTNIRFYTGIPDQNIDFRGSQFWTAKLQGMKNAGIQVTSRVLRYRSKTFRLPLGHESMRRATIYLPDGESLIPGEPLYRRGSHELPDGSYLSVQVGEEKGIDIRLALDLINLTLERAFDVAVIFTQDQDHAETVREVKAIAQQQSRNIKIYSAFPDDGQKRHGVSGTDWIRIDRTTYQRCLDRRNYKQPSRR